MKVYFEEVTYKNGVVIWEIDIDTNQAIADRIFYKSAKFLVSVDLITETPSFKSYQDIYFNQHEFFIPDYKAFVKRNNLTAIDFNDEGMLVHNSSSLTNRLKFFNQGDINSSRASSSFLQHSSSRSIPLISPKHLAGTSVQDLSEDKEVSCTSHSFLLENIIPENQWGKTIAYLKINRTTDNEILALKNKPVVSMDELHHIKTLENLATITTLQYRRMRLIRKIVNRIFHPIVSAIALDEKTYNDLCNWATKAIIECNSNKNMELPLDHDFEKPQHAMLFIKEHLNVKASSQRLEQDRAKLICCYLDYDNLPGYFKNNIQKLKQIEQYNNYYRRIIRNVIETGKQLRVQNADKHLEDIAPNYVSLDTIIERIIPDDIEQRLKNSPRRRFKGGSQIFRAAHPPIRVTLKTKLLEAFREVKRPLPGSNGLIELLINRHITGQQQEYFFIKDSHADSLIKTLYETLNLHRITQTKDYHRIVAKSVENCKVPNLTLALENWWHSCMKLSKKAEKNQGMKLNLESN